MVRCPSPPHLNAKSMRNGIVLLHLLPKIDVVRENQGSSSPPHLNAKSIERVGAPSPPPSNY